MRRIVFSRPVFGFALTLLVALLLPALCAAQSEADTAAARDKTKDTSTGRVKISIDESGISIEGKANIKTDEADDSEEWVEIRDERSKYKEKGLDIVKFGESVFVARDEIIRGDLVVFGGNAMVEGKVIGNVVVIGGDIRARSGSEIKGDAVVIGGTLDEDEDVIISGERVSINSFFPHGLLGMPGSGGRWFKVFVLPVGLFVQLILAFLILLFLKDRIFRGHDHLSNNFLKSFGVGLLSSFIGVFALLIIMIPLFITIIGIPLALLLIVSCVGIFIISWTIFTYSFGRLIAKKLQLQSENAFLFVFIGAVVLILPNIFSFAVGITQATLLAPLAWMFTIIGWFLKGFAYLSGLGAIILSRFGSRALVLGTHPTAAAPPAPSATDV